MTPITDDATLNRMLSDEGVAEKITLERVHSRITGRNFTVVPGTTTTICALTLDNGFVVTGTSACVTPEAFNAKLGEKLAYDRAIEKIFELEAYLLCEERSRIKKAFVADELAAHETYLAEAGHGIAARIAEFLHAEGLSDIQVTVNVAGLDAEPEATSVGDEVMVSAFSNAA